MEAPVRIGTNAWAKDALDSLRFQRCKRDLFLRVVSLNQVQQLNLRGNLEVGHFELTGRVFHHNHAKTSICANRMMNALRIENANVLI